MDGNIQPSDLPLHFADKTYNTANPSFRFWMSNNFSWKFYTHSEIERLLLNFPNNLPFQWYRDLVVKTRARYLELGILRTLDRLLPGRVENNGHPLMAEIRQLLNFGYAKAEAYEKIFTTCLAEIGNDIPQAKEVFANKAKMDTWIEELNARSSGTYFPGWVDDREALFLYWVVRVLKPKVIAQTGVCNGMSSAYMALALERNGGEGKIHAIDLPHIYDPDDPEMNRPVVYGVIIPEGRSSGWLIPESLSHRFEVTIGDAKEELPPLLDRLGEIDMFYHDSDHSYDHMMFEMSLARKHLRDQGTIICDDVGWNQSTWDFAYDQKRPAYNFAGSMGVVFF